MTSVQTKRQKLSTTTASTNTDDPSVKIESLLDDEAGRSRRPRRLAVRKTNNLNLDLLSENNGANQTDEDTEQEGGDDDDDTEEEEEEEDDDDDEDDDDNSLDKRPRPNGRSIQQQLAASGPAGVAAAAAIATARKRKRPHTFETNPSVRKRQQTRLIRKLRACIDEYTARVGQQAIVLITMPGKTSNNFKVFGAQPLESVIRACKHEIMIELEQAVLEQTPNLKLGKDGQLISGQDDDDEAANKHELPPLVIDGIPTPVEKMTQAQLRAFIPLMLKYSTGRGKPGWGKESTRPPWWPTTLPWANVRSDARDEDEKQRISWTTTLREIVTNCYKYHGREDLLPVFDETSELEQSSAATPGSSSRLAASGGANKQDHSSKLYRTGGASRPLGSASTRSAHRLASQQNSLHHQQHHQLISADQLYTTATSTSYITTGSTGAGSTDAASSATFMHTISNPDGTVSLIQVDPSNAQILTLPDGTQVRAVRLQTLGSGETLLDGQLLGGQQEHTGGDTHQLMEQHHQQGQQHDAEGQIILTGEDGTQSCYPMSSLVSIPASMYQQFAQTGQPISIMTSDGSLATANVVHTIHEAQEISAAEANDSADHQQVEPAEDKLASLPAPSKSAEAKSEPQEDRTTTSTHPVDEDDHSEQNQETSKAEGS